MTILKLRKLSWLSSELVVPSSKDVLWDTLEVQVMLCRTRQKFRQPSVEHLLNHKNQDLFIFVVSGTFMLILETMMFLRRTVAMRLPGDYDLIKT